MRARTTRLVGILLCIALATSVVAVPAAAHGADEEEFLVFLDRSGDADVSLTLTYDLHSDAERAAFGELQENETAREASAERFENRMSAVAADASNATGREMAVSSASVQVSETEGVGTMTMTVTWENLAAVEGDRLTVTEPFSSGFDPGVAFTVAVPQGYERTSVTPKPSSSDRTMSTWDAGTDLHGFELVAEPVAEDDGSPTEETDGEGAGFGVVIALGALVAVALLTARRRSVAE